MNPQDKAARIREVSLYFIPIEMRVPLKFGNQVLDSVTCARARVVLEGVDGKSAIGWGETPLAVAWVWPSDLDYEDRHEALKSFSLQLAGELEKAELSGHPIEIGHDFIEGGLHQLQDQFNADRAEGAEMPHLAALVCFSLFDIAIHDAYGHLHDLPIYETYGLEFLSRDLGSMLTPSAEHVSFEGLYPSDFLSDKPDLKLPVWHLVGGLDAISEEELTGNEPDDGYPVLLRDWIRADQLDC
ncbi:MAG: hypothetical protein AAGF67_04985, partial [Verrucomicrobiota bacterium]